MGAGANQHAASRGHLGTRIGCILNVQDAHSTLTSTLYQEAGTMDKTSDGNRDWLDLIRQCCTRFFDLTANVLHEAGVNRPQHNVMSALGREREMTMTALSRKLGVTMGA